MDCKETISELQDLLNIKRKQQQLKERVDQQDTRITKCEVELENVKELKEITTQLTARLSFVEAKLIDTEKKLTF